MLLTILSVICRAVISVYRLIPLNLLLIINIFSFCDSDIFNILFFITRGFIQGVFLS